METPNFWKIDDIADVTGFPIVLAYRISSANSLWGKYLVGDGRSQLLDGALFGLFVVNKSKRRSR